jgi:hypothetical protein
LDPLIKSQLLSGKFSVTETDSNLITWTELYGDECREPLQPTSLAERAHLPRRLREDALDFLANKIRPLAPVIVQRSVRTLTAIAIRRLVSSNENIDPKL